MAYERTKYGEATTTETLYNKETGQWEQVVRAHDLEEANAGITDGRVTFSKWFVCPVNGTTHREGEGIRISGVLYSPDAAQDIIESRARRRARR